ncbi:hypothetical protein V2O64_16595 [Verrucomicrobiaceae bacterium 227]
MNALIRCTRRDSAAADLFELVRPDLGLWVLELDYKLDGEQAEQLAGICDQLQLNLPGLRKLRNGSVDYTLHLTFDLLERQRIIFPPRLLRLASECGFNLELYTTRDEED